MTLLYCMSTIHLLQSTEVWCNMCLRTLYGVMSHQLSVMAQSMQMKQLLAMPVSCACLGGWPVWSCRETVTVHTSALIAALFTGPLYKRTWIRTFVPLLDATAAAILSTIFTIWVVWCLAYSQHSTWSDLAALCWNSTAPLRREECSREHSTDCLNSFFLRADINSLLKSETRGPRTVQATRPMTADEQAEERFGLG